MIYLFYSTGDRSFIRWDSNPKLQGAGEAILELNNAEQEQYVKAGSIPVIDESLVVTVPVPADVTAKNTANLKLAAIDAELADPSTTWAEQQELLAVRQLAELGITPASGAPPVVIGP